MARKMLGIEIGNCDLKICVCRGEEVQDYLQVELPDNVVANGQVRSFNSVADLLKTTVKENRIRVRDCAIVLPDDAYYLRRVTLPKMTTQQLEINLPYELHDFLSGEVSGYFYDYSLIRYMGSRMDLIAAAADKRLVQKYVQMCRRAGLNLVKLVPNVLALQAVVMADERTAPLDAVPVRTKEEEAAEAAEKAAKKKERKPLFGKKTLDIDAEGSDEETKESTKSETERAKAEAASLSGEVSYERGPDYVVLDIGHGGSRMHFFSNHAYEITRTLQTSSDQIVHLLSEDAGVDPHIARIRLAANQDNCLSLPRIDDAVSTMLTEINRVMNFYNYNNPNNTISCLYLFGTGLPEDVMEQRISEALELPVHSIADLMPEQARVDGITNGPQTWGAVVE
ncbi:MAG: pilus assembly protein PilM [Lachnospiraceae bacterium]|jgi:Tfp pilus assembly PilM family ATPase